MFTCYKWLFDIDKWRLLKGKMLSGSKSTKSGLTAVDRMNGALMERRREGGVDDGRWGGRRDEELIEGGGERRVNRCDKCLLCAAVQAVSEGGQRIRQIC